MDGIIDTVSAPHSVYPLVSLLKTSGNLILVGVPASSPELPSLPLIMGKPIYACNMHALLFLQHFFLGDSI